MDAVGCSKCHWLNVQGPLSFLLLLLLLDVSIATKYTFYYPPQISGDHYQMSSGLLDEDKVVLSLGGLSEYLKRTHLLKPTFKRLVNCQEYYVHIYI